MKVDKITALARDEGHLAVMVDPDGLQWFGTGAAIYPAYGWPALDDVQTKELFSLDYEPVHRVPKAWKIEKTGEAPATLSGPGFELAEAPEADYWERKKPRKYRVIWSGPRCYLLNVAYLDALEQPAQNLKLFPGVLLDGKSKKPMFIAEDSSGKRLGIIFPHILSQEQRRGIRRAARSIFVFDKVAWKMRVQRVERLKDQIMEAWEDFKKCRQ